MKRIIASLLCALLAAPGCATSQGPRVQVAPQLPGTSSSDREVLGEFARQLPLGARVRATVAAALDIATAFAEHGVADRT